jgi:hypothetical protein
MKQVRYFLFGGKNYRDNDLTSQWKLINLQRQRKRNLYEYPLEQCSIRVVWRMLLM